MRLFFTDEFIHRDSGMGSEKHFFNSHPFLHTYFTLEEEFNILY